MGVCVNRIGTIWWGYGLHPERKGDYVDKRMDDRTGAEILEEVVRQLKFDGKLGTIMASSTCIPCNIPYVNNMPRNRAGQPNGVPEWGDQSRAHRPVRWGFRRISRSRSSTPPAPPGKRFTFCSSAAPAAASTSGSVRSEGAARRAEGVFRAVRM